MKNLLKTFGIFLVLAAMCLFSVSAFAAGGGPKKATKANVATGKCVDNDEDGYCEGADDDEKKTGWDCNDDNKSVHPGAKEIWDNGVDENCDTEDSETPPIALLRSFGVDPNNKPAVVRLMKEIAVCESENGCHVNKTKGTFKADNNDGVYFIDTDCDGVREVLDQAGKDAHDIELKKGMRCQNAPSPCQQHHRRHHAKAKAWSVPLPGGVTPTAGTTVRITQQQSAANQAAIAKAQSTGDAATIKADKAQQTADGANANSTHAVEVANAAKQLVDAQATQIEVAKAGIKLVADNLRTEVKARRADITELKEENDARDKHSDIVDHKIDELQQTGFFLQLGIGAGMIVQGHLYDSTTGTNYRGFFAPGLRFTANLGKKTTTGSLAVFWVANPVWDNGPTGPETGMAYQFGTEGLMRLSSKVSAGAHALYQQHFAGGQDENGGNMLNPNAVSRGIGIGPSFSMMGSRFGAQVRLTVGYEKYAGYGPGGDTPAKVNGGLFTGLSIDFLTGVGPSLTPNPSKAMRPVVVTPPPPPPPAVDADEDENDEDDSDLAPQ